MKSRKTPVQRFMGLSLAGGKTSKTQLAIVDFYPVEKKAFLTHVFRDIGEDQGKSADAHLLQIIKDNSENLVSISVDAPLSDPPSFRCKAACHHLEKCNCKAIRWMWDMHAKNQKERRPNKMFTPYTERCVEQYLSFEVAPYFPMDHALGSNRAPIWARAHYLKKHLGKTPLLEVFPRLNVWRVGRALKVGKTHLMFYKNAVDGAEHRMTLLHRLMDVEWLFIYNQDAKSMIKEAPLFEAVLSAFVGYLQSRKLCEVPPKGFPKDEGWIQFPVEDFNSRF